MIIIPINNNESNYAYTDCGIVCQTAVLAAESMGVNTLICGLAGLAFSGERKEEFSEKLGFQEGYQFGICILFGYSDNETKPHTPNDNKITYIE